MGLILEQMVQQPDAGTHSDSEKHVDFGSGTNAQVQKQAVEQFVPVQQNIARVLRPLASLPQIVLPSISQTLLQD